jgi:hypothetical protein
MGCVVPNTTLSSATVVSQPVETGRQVSNAVAATPLMFQWRCGVTLQAQANAALFQ